MARSRDSAVQTIIRMVDPKRYIEYLEASREAPKSEEEFEKVLEARRHQANIDAFDQLVQLNDQRMVWAARVQRHLDDTFTRLQAMTLTAFVMGLVLILVPFALYFSSPTRDANLLWFSGIGFVETLTALLYRPMQRMQQSVSDLVQSIIILNSWVTHVGLTLYDMKLGSPGAVAAATDRIDQATLRHVRWIQTFTEDEAPKPRAPATPKAKAGKKAPGREEKEPPPAEDDASPAPKPPVRGKSP